MSQFSGIDSPAEAGFIGPTSSEPSGNAGRDAATSSHSQTKSPNIPLTVEHFVQQGDARVPKGGKGNVDRSVTTDALTKDN
jgi:hypothetical protein